MPKSRRRPNATSASASSGASAAAPRKGRAPAKQATRNEPLAPATKPPREVASTKKMPISRAIIDSDEEASARDDPVPASTSRAPKPIVSTHSTIDQRSDEADKRTSAPKGTLVPDASHQTAVPPGDVDIPMHDAPGSAPPPFCDDDTPIPAASSTCGDTTEPDAASDSSFRADSSRSAKGKLKRRTSTALRSQSSSGEDDSTTGTKRWKRQLG